MTLCVLVMSGHPSLADTPTRSDVTYGTAGVLSLKLDFYEPTQPRRERPLLIWIHGGAWRSGSKSDVPVKGLRHHGFAIASVDYRLSPVARFPAQIHDIKAAVRYLRLHARELGVDADRFVLAGASAGGHLAVLSAVSDGVQELSGVLPASQETSSGVQAVVSFYGAGNLQTILSQSTPYGLKVRVPALELLLGGVPDKEPALARLASPVVHIDSNDPPLWLFHGDQDPQMPINQSHELVGACKRAGVPVQFEVVHGGAHGGAEFFSEERLRRLGDELHAALHQTGRSTSPESNGAREGKKAKVYQLTRADIESLPSMDDFRDQPTDQFIVPWDVYRTGHPYLGSRAKRPHTGGHLYFHVPDVVLDPSRPETYPPIYACANGIVTRVDEAFRLRPIYFPNSGTTRSNVRYGVDFAFARSGNRPVTFHYSIEPMVDPGDLEFYRRFLLVVPGQRVRKGETIARMYLPPKRADFENSHIHFNLIRERQFQAPSIFSASIVEKFAAGWDQQRMREDWPIPPCMGWRIEPAEDPFAEP
ncbi:MAG: alpha/beta hydrolase fold domain-containing protein [Pirellulaceae bacterium]